MGNERGVMQMRAHAGDGSGQPQPSAPPGERLRRLVDWALLPVSAGVIVNLIGAGVIGAGSVFDGLSWRTASALSAVVLTAGVKAYAER